MTQAKNCPSSSTQQQKPKMCLYILVYNQSSIDPPPWNCCHYPSSRTRWININLACTMADELNGLTQTDNSVFPTDHSRSLSPIFWNDPLELLGWPGYPPVDHGFQLPRSNGLVSGPGLLLAIWHRAVELWLLSAWLTSVSVAPLTIKMYRHSVSIFFLLI